MMFDLEKIRNKCGIKPEDFARLEKKVREEFRGDAMMFELHMWRT